jgi:hypothetical protein
MGEITELGRLERADPQIVWPHEAHDFTPWLFNNGDRLADALGIELELDATEHPVGGYRLDIIGRDLTNGADLMVENQFGVTDHGHLGQVLTYAAGTGARTVVWIARTFREEHRQALDWLNGQSDEKTHFFGIEVCVGRIGDSAWAPLLDVVVQPNEWQKMIRQPGALQGRGALYADFWPRLVARVNSEHPTWTKRKAESLVRERNWIEMPSPLRDTVFSLSFSQDGLRHELYIDTGDDDTTRAVYTRLEAAKDRLEAEYGRPLSFEPLSDRRASRIAEYMKGDISEEERHDDFVEFFVGAGVRMRRALLAVEGELSA